MASHQAYYFIRVNGESIHCDPRMPQCYVPSEPRPAYYNYVQYCLRHGLIRIGWPDIGDLRGPPKTGALGRCYDLSTINPHERRYLEQFADIGRGSVILMPDKDRPGALYVGEVTGSYDYFHQPPEHPYECAHRMGVRWDRRDGRIVEYRASDFGINIRGGFWMRAFHRLDAKQKAEVLRKIDAARGGAGIDAGTA